MTRVVLTLLVLVIAVAAILEVKLAVDLHGRLASESAARTR